MLGKKRNLLSMHVTVESSIIHTNWHFMTIEQLKYVHIITLCVLLQVAQVLSSLERFFQEIEPQVDAISGEESDTLAFMKLMSIFNRVSLV